MRPPDIGEDLRDIKRRAEPRGLKRLVNASYGLNEEDSMTAIEAFVTWHPERTSFALALPSREPVSCSLLVLAGSRPPLSTS